MKIVSLLIALLYSIGLAFGQTQDDPNFNIPLKGGGIVFTWSQPENRTVFACGGADSAQKEIIRGITFTYRAGSPQSIEPACNYWANSVTRIISGKGIKDKQWKPEVSYDQGGHYSAIEVVTFDDGDIINSPITYRNFLSSSGAHYGSYVSSIRQKKLLSTDTNYFSQGVFGPPLKNIPKDGSATYSVLLSSKPYTKRLPAVQINFSKAELTVLGQFAETGPVTVQLFTAEPIKINRDGTFMGEMTLSLRGGMGVSNVKAYLAGFLGGDNGEVFYASYIPASSLLQAEFILGEKESARK